MRDNLGINGISESDFWHQRENKLGNNKEEKEPHRESLKNNFMEPENDNSLFSKFRKNKESNPELNHIGSKPPLAANRDRSQELKRAKQAKKKLAEEKKTMSYDEERKEAKSKKARMDEIKNKYTKLSRSRSRKRSNSKGPKSCITKLGKYSAQSEIQINPRKAKNPRNKIIRDSNTEIVQGRMRPNKLRKHSPDDTTKCTREDDLNIGQFLWDDLAYLNKEEAKLQQELLVEHKNTIMQVKAVERKHDIDTGIVNTRQMVKKLNNVDPYETMKKYEYRNETEDQIEESLENLNFLLAQKDKSKGEKKKAYKKMAEKMDIRLDSSSPVRQVNFNQKKSNKISANPFAYEPSKNDEYEIPNFKPRSMIGESEDAISRITKPKSVITQVPNKNKNEKLLNKEKKKIGSYLNAQNLEVILNILYSLGDE